MDLWLHSINYALDGDNWLTLLPTCVILWWPLDRMMSGLQTYSGYFDEGRISVSVLGIELGSSSL